jgi:hypothetical protein
LVVPSRVRFPDDISKKISRRPCIQAADILGYSK